MVAESGDVLHLFLTGLDVVAQVVLHVGGEEGGAD